MTPLIVCADDYGLAPGVNKAIRQLIAAGSITATSCMTTLPEWPTAAKELAPFFGQADIGLHFTLTNLAPLGKLARLAPQGRLPSLFTLMRMSFAGRVPSDEVREELELQLDAFETAFGRSPDYLDGHQHVHALPTISSVVVEVFSRRLAPHGAYLRWPGDRLGSILSRRVGLSRALTLYVLGGPLRRAAHRHGIELNDAMTGLYDLSDRVPYEQLFPQFLKGIDGKTILLCHPGEVDAVLRERDPLLQPREAELAFFNSQQYLDMVASAGARLSRFHQTI